MLHKLKFYHIKLLCLIGALHRKMLQQLTTGKSEKNIPDMLLPWNLKGWSSWSKKLQMYLKNYDLCEYVEFGVISWKFDILSITA